MPLTEKQIKLLNELSDTEWTYNHNLRSRHSKSTVTALIKNKKIAAVKIHIPNKITDKDVGKGEILTTVKPFGKNDYWPDFIKRIDNSYKTHEENKLFILEDKINKLEKQIDILLDKP